MNLMCSFCYIYALIMPHSGICITLLLLQRLQSCSSAGPLRYNPGTGRETSLASSTWPSDHGDSSRTKYTVDAGLPEGFAATNVNMIYNTELHLSQWLYTAGDNSEYIYTMSGTGSRTVSKSNSTTLEILQSVTIEAGIYIGGLLIHANGHVYCVHANSIIAFWNGDLYNSTKRTIPSALNGRLVQTNGVIVTSDGLLAVKQWDFIPEDLFLYVYVFFRIPILLFLFSIVASGIYFIFKIGTRLRLPLQFVVFFSTTFGPLLGVLFLLIFFMCLFCALGFYPFDPIRFLTTNMFANNRGGGGELKLIDPITLEVRAELVLAERCSFARMAMTALPNGEDGFVLLGDEYVHQYRWNSITGSLYEIQEWSTRYRTRWGTFPGTGPAIYNNTAYFTDNTFPVNLFAKSYHMFSMSLLMPTDGQQQSSRGGERREECTDVSLGGGTCYTADTVPVLKNVSLTNATAGFMYWSVVVSPATGDIIVWDTAGGSVQARRAEDLSLHWEISAWQGDCITIAADRGHVYMSDYSSAPSAWYYWMNSVGPASGSLYDGVEKYFIVASTDDGSIIANISMNSGGGVKPALIVPGANGDVFFPTARALARIYVN